MKQRLFNLKDTESILKNNGDATLLLTTNSDNKHDVLSTIEVCNRRYLSCSTRENDLSRLYIPLKVKVFDDNEIEVCALIDSGSDCSLISESFALNHKLFMQPLKKSITFEVIDGSDLPSGNPTSFTNCDLKYDDVYFKFKLIILKTLHASIILGMDWLQKFNPIIDWKLCTLSIPLKFESLYNKNDEDVNMCKNVRGWGLNPQPHRQKQTVETYYPFGSPKIFECKNSTKPKKILVNNLKCSTNPEDNPAENIEEDVPEYEEINDIKMKLPSKYHDYASVFSKHQCDLLPEHRKYDISIDIIKDKTIPWGPIYPLSDPELDTLKCYLDENLKKGFIRPSSSPAGAPLFFVKKKSGELRPVIDYRGLNAITVQTVIRYH